MQTHTALLFLPAAKFNQFRRAPRLPLIPDPTAPFLVGYHNGTQLSKPPATKPTERLPQLTTDLFPDLSVSHLRSSNEWDIISNTKTPPNFRPQSRPEKLKNKKPLQQVNTGPHKSSLGV